jgi:RNA polymerase sigma-70 factor (ECF subfamily)
LGPADAEDLTQDVLLKLFQQLPSYRHDPARGPFRSWLKAVVNNTLTDYWRRRGPECGAVGGTGYLMRAAELADPDAAIELSTALEEHARVTAADVVARVRAKVKETTWQAFYQSLVEERPAAEIAAALNLSVASVYKATYRVKQMLLEEHNHVRHPAGTGPDLVPGAGDPGEAVA